MLAQVTNRARGARGFEVSGGGTHVLEPGDTARLDLAEHALHHVWQAAGEVAIVAVADQRSDEDAAARHETGAGPHPAIGTPAPGLPSGRKAPFGATRHRSRLGED